MKKCRVICFRSPVSAPAEALAPRLAGFGFSERSMLHIQADLSRNSSLVRYMPIIQRNCEGRNICIGVRFVGLEGSEVELRMTTRRLCLVIMVEDSTINLPFI